MALPSWRAKRSRHGEHSAAIHLRRHGEGSAAIHDCEFGAMDCRASLAVTGIGARSDGNATYAVTGKFSRMTSTFEDDFSVHELQLGRWLGQIFGVEGFVAVGVGDAGGFDALEVMQLAIHQVRWDDIL